MTREHSGGQPIGRRGTTGRKNSPATPMPEGLPQGHYDDSQRSSDDEVVGSLAQLSERFQKVQQDNEAAEGQITEEEEEFQMALSQLEEQRDELKQQVKERDEQSSELRRQVHKLESESRAKQSEKTKKERQLLQKESQHKKRRDEIAMWDEQITSMKKEVTHVEQQQLAMQERTESELRNVRKKIEDEQEDVRLLDEENKEKALQIRSLEEERTRLNEEEETEETIEADRLDQEKERQWREKAHNLSQTYTQLWNALTQAKTNFEVAKERLLLCEHARRMSSNASIGPPASLNLDAIRKDMRPRRARQRGSMASSMSSPVSNFPPNDSYSAITPFHHQTTTASPTFSGPAFFNPNNGMTLTAPVEEPALFTEEVDTLTGGAPMSPRADALLPSNLLGDESADDEAEENLTMPTQPTATDTKATSFPRIGPSSLFDDAQKSPSPVSSSSRSFSSPRESFTNAMDPDKSSLQSGRLSIDQSDQAGNAQSASRKLTGLFSFSRQRGKTLVDEPPMLGSLKQGQSQSFPRNYGDDADVLAARRRRGYSGNWGFPMTNLLPRNSGGSSQPKPTETNRLTSRRAFLNPFSGLGKSSTSSTNYDPFSARSDSLDATLEGGIRSDGSRPTSLYSFDNLPRPSVESQFLAWGPHERSSNLRGSPLAPDWSASQTWSRSHSRRPSIQYGSTSNLSLHAPTDEDFLEPPRENARPLQAPIGTRPTSSQRPLTPKLNPAAPSFQFFARKGDKNKDKAKSKSEKIAPDPVSEDASPTDSRKSRDIQSLATTAESRESLERTPSGQSSGMPSETTPAKETGLVRNLKLITRKSSSSRFNSWKDKGGLFSSRKGEPSTPGEIDEDTSSDHQLGKSVESTSTTTTGGEKEKDEKSRSKSSLSWSFMRKNRKGAKGDLAPSEVSESSERASEVGDEDTAEEGEGDE